MPPTIEQELKRLEQLSVGQLLQVDRDLFGQPSKSRHKRHLIRRIVWGLQAREEGGLSHRALRRAAQIVEPTELKLPPTNARTRSKTRPPERRTPIPGTVLRRVYKGQVIQVKVLDDGFEYDGQVFQTLTALAKSITGSHWNGYRFFDLPSPRAPKRNP